MRLNKGESLIDLPLPSRESHSGERRRRENDREREPSSTEDVHRDEVSDNDEGIDLEKDIAGWKKSFFFFSSGTDAGSSARGKAIMKSSQE
jgi:hypothetical protein